MDIGILISRKKKHSFFAETQLQIDQIKKKVKFLQAIFFSKVNYFQKSKQP